ncbi:MAG: glutathione synthase [Candidatus Omnitrophica bacterium]|nr:glutathione synthase [Candidatus Omnitrophota bacterium]
MKFVFLMDPLQTVIMEKDTTFIIMTGAHRKGHETYFLPDGGMTLTPKGVQFNVTKVIPQQDSKNPFVIQKKLVLTEDDVDAIFIRTDPPFDAQYLFNTWLLDRVAQTIPVINNPSGIRTVNEKLWATQFTSLIPRTLVGQTKKDLLDFIDQEQTVIAKPTDSFGGQGIFLIKKDGPNINVTLETLTNNFSKDIILQQYIPEADIGDKRILLLNGDPIGALLRVHSDGEHRNNFFSGGKPQAVDITDRDKEIIAALKPHLQKLGLYFVGIDIIGDYLIEVNVTSPTCVQEVNRLNNLQLEDQIIAFAENLVDR